MHFCEFLSFTILLYEVVRWLDLNTRINKILLVLHALSIIILCFACTISLASACVRSCPQFDSYTRQILCLGVFMLHVSECCMASPSLKKSKWGSMSVKELFIWNWNVWWQCLNIFLLNAYKIILNNKKAIFKICLLNGLLWVISETGGPILTRLSLILEKIF